MELFVSCLKIAQPYLHVINKKTQVDNYFISEFHTERN